MIKYIKISKKSCQKIIATILFNITFVPTKKIKLHLWTVQEKNRIEINSYWYGHVVLVMTFYGSVIPSTIIIVSTMIIYYIIYDNNINCIPILFP